MIMLWATKDKDDASKASKKMQQAYKGTMTVKRKWKKKWNCLPKVLHLLKLFYKQERQNKGLQD